MNTRAAENLHVSQSAVSRQIKLLEEEFDQKLFRRSKYCMIPTDAGALLMTRAAEILELADRTQYEISKKQEIQGDLSIGFIDRVFSETTAQLLSGFQMTYPKIRLHSYCGALNYTNELFRKQKVGIVYTFTSNASAYDHIIKTGVSLRLGFVMTQDNPIADHSEITEELYTNVPVIMPMGNMYDNEGQSMKIKIPKDNIVAEVEEPLDFLFMVKKAGACMYCLEPPVDLPDYRNLIFRPAGSHRLAELCFIQHPDIEPTEVMSAFMEYAGQFYK